ncbi:glycosyltransferase family 1 protein [Pseudoalteromonas sp. SG43-5]|uniref:glycosyltransferase family 4 protein n=1 Tax=Pseudoalteromonas sp. SG43-5 TaxID=2760968 RepID=UPI0015FF7DEC|nr:glycosyltransferase family 1 protein [Pseudoalteromonas sp. SG43-5]MBB1456684.1 glycosyltransferase family 4 protein [Pseudoalteromonas sp. SG43-5]
MKKIDSRWCANHGIGRFASEMRLDKHGETIEGSFSDIFSPLDPLRLFLNCRIDNAWFISPSYNCPIFWHRRSIITIHDLMHIYFPDYAGLKNKVYYDYLVKPVCKKTPLIFTVSEYTKHEIAKWANINPDKIVVVYNGVDENYTVSVNPHKHLKPYVLYVGDKKPHKNIKRLMEAFSKSVVSNTHDLMLSGNSNDEILAWASEFNIIDKVVFAGFIPENDLPSYYKGASLLALPSLYEGFGLPIIEAMAVGTPVLTSNVTAMPEIAGDAAILINPVNVNEITKGLNDLISDINLRNSLIIKGLERVKAFNWDASRIIWNDSINKVVGN